MADKFGRKYRLTIGGTNDIGASSNLRKSAVLTELHIEFDIKVTKKSKLNTLELKIYNLKQETITLFEVKDVLVTLEVAYADEPFVVIFRGDKTSMKTVSDPPDIITTVVAAEGYSTTRESRIQKPTPEGSTVESIIRTIVKDSMPAIKSVNINGDATKKVYKKGYSLNGNSKAQIDDICKANNLDWTIEKNETIYVFPKKGDIKVEAIVISPDNGLLAKPEKTSQDVRNLKDDLDIPPDSGIRFQCLLNPLIKAGQIVQIQGTFNSDGNYRVDSVSHKGGYESQDWTTTIEASNY